jgi:hypothetical protein
MPLEFLLNLLALANFMCLSLLRDAYRDVSSATWEGIRLRSG